MKVLAYVRVSKEIQETAGQHKQIRAWAEFGGHEILEWIEEKVSATRKKAANRPGWREVMAIIRRRKPRIEAVVVFRLDRAFRDVKDAVVEIDKLHQAGAAFVSVSEGFDLTTPQGEFTMHVIAAFAQMEARIQGERVKAGLSGTGGRLPVIPQEKVGELVRKRREGASWRELVHQYPFARTTIRRTVTEAILRGAENLAETDAAS